MAIDYTRCVLMMHPNMTNKDFGVAVGDDGKPNFVHWNGLVFGGEPTFEHLETVWWIQVLKTDKKAEIKQALQDEMEIGAKGYRTVGLGVKNFTVNSSRADLDNMKNLISYMQYTGMSTTNVRGRDNTFMNLTVAEIQKVVWELIAYGLYLYQRKWQKEALVESATTPAQVEAIKFW